MMLLLLLLPLLASVSMLLFKGKSAQWVALLAALANFALTVLALASFDATGAVTTLLDWDWIPSAGIRFHLGYDGISMLLLFLTNLLIPLIIGSSWDKYEERAPLFFGLVLLMQFALIGVFTALDGLVFYLIWEIALIPIYFICAIWGNSQFKIPITLKFFIYTFVGSLFMLLSLIYLYLQTPAPHSFDWAALQQVKLSTESAVWVILGLFLAFAIKMPVFPFHTWQPDTYTIAPTGGTQLLSGIMLKMGIYGVIRWMLPLAPEALGQLNPMFMLLAVMGIVYASIIAITQSDIKRLVAYSSIAHVGLIAAGVFAMNTSGWQGAMIQMLNHGINVVGLFLVCDILESRLQTRQLSEMGGIAKNAPKLAVLFMIILLGSVAVPLTNGFVGEFLLLHGIYQYGWLMAAVAGLTIIFCAVYMLRMYQFTLFGSPNARTAQFADLTTREFILLSVISALVLYIGVAPQYFFDLTAASVAHVLQLIQQQ